MRTEMLLGSEQTGEDKVGQKFPIYSWRTQLEIFDEYLCIVILQKWLGNFSEVNLPHESSHGDFSRQPTWSLHCAFLIFGVIFQKCVPTRALPPPESNPGKTSKVHKQILCNTLQSMFQKTLWLKTRCPNISCVWSFVHKVFSRV